jgi:putative glutamine amidotransferase
MFLSKINQIKSSFVIALLSAIFASSAQALPTARDTFKDLIGQEFIDNGQNTVHEWVYDFLLAVEEGDEELLRESLKELKHADAGNRAVLLQAGVKLARELGRDRQWQMLKGRLNRISSVPAAFSLDAAEACELTRQRNAEKAQGAGNSSVTEWLMSNTAFRTAFVLAAGLPVASAATMAINVGNATWGNISCGLTDVATQSPHVIAPPPRDFRQEMLALTANIDGRHEIVRLARLIYSESRAGTEFNGLPELLPHLFAKSIVRPDQLWDAFEYSDPGIRGYKLILEAGGAPPKRGPQSLINLLYIENYDAAELFLDYGADPLPVLENLQALLFTKISSLSLFERILRGVEKIPTNLHKPIEDCMKNKFSEAARWSSDADLDQISNAWILLINKGLPFDLGHFSIQNGADSAKKQKFLERILAETQVDVNRKEENGRTLFENALEMGNFEVVAMLKEKGGYTKRPVIAMVTAYSRDGVMYLAATKTLRGKGAIVVPLTVPESALRNSHAAIMRDYRKKPQDVLKSGHAEVDAIFELARRALRGVDAIWISGGNDVWESWYKDGSDYAACLARDILEIAVLQLQSQEPYKPLIGVCRGHQMINVFYGGTLRDVGEGDVSIPLVIEKRHGLLGSSFPDKASGWSQHSQSVDQVADMFEPVLKSGRRQDGMVKAIQPKTKDLPLFGIQFHPEYVDDPDPAREHILRRFLNMAMAAKHNTCFEPEYEENEKCRLGILK